jgi:hypothetical protein
MARESKTFEVLDGHVQNEAVRLQGDLFMLNRLKTYLGRRGIAAAFSRSGASVGLNICSDTSTDHVRQVLEEWPG